jgi:hypothetical protein
MNPLLRLRASSERAALLGLVAAVFGGVAGGLMLANNGGFGAAVFLGAVGGGGLFTLVLALYGRSLANRDIERLEAKRHVGDSAQGDGPTASG